VVVGSVLTTATFALVVEVTLSMGPVFIDLKNFQEHLSLGFSFRVRFKAGVAKLFDPRAKFVTAWPLEG